MASTALSRTLGELVDFGNTSLNQVNTWLTRLDIEGKQRHETQLVGLRGLNHQFASLQKSLEPKLLPSTSQAAGPIGKWCFTLADSNIRPSQFHCDLHFGLLRISTVNHSISLGGAAPQRDEKQWTLKIHFIPPVWISATSFQCSINLRWFLSMGSMSIQVGLNPLTVNRDPRLLKALKELDLPALRSLVDKGIVRPSDHVLDSSRPPNILSLIDVRPP